MTDLPWIVAHRGDTSSERENTLAAFRAAILAGADMIELDVRRLADEVLVVFHDDEISDTAIADIGYGELHELAVDARIEIPTFDQALELCAGRIRLVVELKSACAEEVVRAVYNARVRVDEYVLASFDSGVLLQLRLSHPGIRTALLTEDISYEKARDLLDGVAPNLWAPDSPTLDDTVLARCEKARIAVLPWTVNDDTELRRFLSAETVAGIITDRTQNALNLRRTLRGIRSAS
jgi:glycerophosphoryl diester phosphodiesterase